MRTRALPLAFMFLTACVGAVARAGAASFDVAAYGAVGDGKTLDTAAVNRAIAAAAAAGGGTVRAQAGTFLVGSIHLRSGVALYLGPGAELRATADPTAYDEPERNPWVKYQDFGHSHFHNSLIWGENLHDISIFGPGRIDGRGLTSEQNRRQGNKSIALKLCRNVILRDFTIVDSGHCGVLANGVDNLTIDNLKIDTGADGIDVISCRSVRISNCTINSPGDDALCLKSDYALGFARATENVTITNVQVSGYEVGALSCDPALRQPRRLSSDGDGVGRIKFGTESNGGFRNIAISNCVFDNCRGLALETVDGGAMEDISISNITMRGVPNSPLFLRLGARMRGPEGAVIGPMRRICISNLTAYDVAPDYACIISGVPGHDIEDVMLNNIRIFYRGGGTREQAARPLPELADRKPEARMFGITPAYGFYIRHAKNVRMDNVQVSFMNEDLRPAFGLIDVKGAEFIDVKARVAAGAAAFDLKDVSRFAIHRARGLRDMNLKSVKQRIF